MQTGKSNIITTNISFDSWQEIFKDPILSAAIVDRLPHKGYIININGNSYRLKESEEWLKSIDNKPEQFQLKKW